ncbi:MAG: hypothetical protein U9P80_03485, partial [Thermodesulfobacteriota bacterium]|nr:hypothetical protein [Thermodesulfobacteriota bacterium]
MKIIIRGMLYVLLISLLVACSGSDGQDPAVAGAGAEDAYSEGAIVPATGYSDDAEITVYALSSGTFAGLGNGYVVDAEETLGVRLNNGTISGARVFVSDGAGYQVEAVSDNEGTYVCEYRFDRELLIYPLLVQVIYD